MFSMNSADFIKSMMLAAERLQTNTKSAVNRAAANGALYARVTRLYKNRTGALRGSIQNTTTGPYSARTAATAKHAAWIENGTAAHEIKARRKLMLRFEQNGAVRFERRVFHPGTAPRPFMKEARDKVEPLFERLCIEAVRSQFT